MANVRVLKGEFFQTLYIKNNETKKASVMNKIYDIGINFNDSKQIVKKLFDVKQDLFKKKKKLNIVRTTPVSTLSTPRINTVGSLSKRETMKTLSSINTPRKTPSTQLSMIKEKKSNFFHLKAISLITEPAIPKFSLNVESDLVNKKDGCKSSRNTQMKFKIKSYFTRNDFYY